MKRVATTTLFLTLALAACEESQTSMTEVDAPSLTAAMDAHEGNIVDAANSMLEAQGSAYRIAQAEFITNDPQAASKNIIIARDLGNKRLSLDFIPDDPRRTDLDNDPHTIDVWVDQTQGATASGLTEPETTTSIAAAMSTWDGQRCSDLGMNFAAVPANLGLVEAIVFGFPTAITVSDVMHAGWLPPAFFNAIAPGGANFILGVTFTLVFTMGDLDGDGQPDLSSREIYYNDNFVWNTTGAPGGADVETIALHEAGHALSQGHFGTIRVNANTGNVQFSPRAVMNAVYFGGAQRQLAGTDRGGHCGLWGSWPNN